MQARGIIFINTMASDAISLAPLDLGADSMTPESGYVDGVIGRTTSSRPPESMEEVVRFH